MPEHSFVVPAYGCSVHLEACLQSLRAQTLKSELILSTSTPDDEQEALAAKYGARYYTHSPNQGIAHDWNTGLRQVTTEWATLAHQDDVYYPDFAEKTLAGITRSRSAILAFTNYDEIADDLKRPMSKLLLVKRALLELGFAGRERIGSRLAKTNTLRFGCSIPCPSVTINVKKAPVQFDEQLKIDLDWAAWLQLARTGGEFVWIRGKSLMGHRIHDSSETTAGISDGRRGAEDVQVLEQLWPKPIARLIARTYGFAYASNQH